MPNRKNNNKNTTKILWPALITAAVTSLGSFLVYYGNKDSVQVDLYNSTLTHMQKYQDNNRILQEENSKKELKIRELELMISELSNRKGNLESYIENIPAPVWIKKLNDDNEFEMLILNRAYLSTYGIDKFGYVGKTDYDFWPKETADEFKREDFVVYLTGNSLTRMAPIPLNGETVEHVFMKFRVDLPDGKSGVGGILLDTTESKSLEDL